MALVNMRRLSNLELARKLFHIIVGTVLAALFYYEVLTPLRFTVLLGGITLLFLLYTQVNIPLLHQFMFYVERKENVDYFPGIGAIFFVFGMTSAAWLFSKPVATAAILILAWGDGIAGIVGPYGKLAYINPKKTWEGLIVAVFSSVVVASFVIPAFYAFVAATFSMLIEGLDLTFNKWRINDNLIVPVLSGLVIVLVGMVV
jgi:dolichol kinase